MIRIENAVNGMKVYHPKRGRGTLDEVVISEANRAYGHITFDESGYGYVPLDTLARCNF